MTAGGRPSLTARAAAVLALLLGLAYAAVSAYWALGGTALLATVGGVFEQAGLHGGGLARAGLWLVVLVKVVAAALPILALSLSLPLAIHRLLRALSWAGAAVLTIYGGVFTAGDVLSLAGLVGGGAAKNQTALTWHGALWDPWFLLWGLLGLFAMFASRRQR